MTAAGTFVQKGNRRISTGPWQGSQRHGYENRSLEVISLPDLETFSIPLDFVPGHISASSDGSVYISSNHGYEDLVKCNLAEGTFVHLTKPEAITYGGFAYNGHIYYPSLTGTKVMSEQGTGTRMLISDYHLNKICFSDDGTLFGIVTKFPETGIELQHTEYYLELHLNIMGLLTLDTEYVDWLS